MKEANIQYDFYKADFISAYKNNGNNIEMSLAQVAMLRDIEKEKLRTILRHHISNLEGAKEIMCDGILYKPNGCKQKLGTYKFGCGLCGTGNHKICHDWNKPNNG